MHIPVLFFQVKHLIGSSYNPKAIDRKQTVATPGNRHTPYEGHINADLGGLVSCDHVMADIIFL